MDTLVSARTKSNVLNSSFRIRNKSSERDFGIVTGVTKSVEPAMRLRRNSRKTRLPRQPASLAVGAPDDAR